MARKKGMQFIPYDYEAAYNKALEDMHEWFIENLFQHRKKVVYALKEITAGDQFEIEIYPQFRSMDEVPPEGRTIKKDNNNISKYNISAERAFLQSVRECRAETVILFEHLKQALASLKEDAEAAGEGYKYDALEAVYIKGKTYEDIVRETGCGRNSPKKWCKVMIQRLSIKLFGAKAIENDRNGVKTG